MSVYKRSVHTDALATLGTLIDDKPGRDAIHLAVEPVIAGERLFPGQDIGLGEDGKAYAHSGVKKVGIVDPFLKEPIWEDKRFWLIVYPRTITSLRHVWEHPDFDKENEDRAYAEPQIKKPSKKKLKNEDLMEEVTQDSIEWIKTFAGKIRQDYDDLMTAANKWINTDDGRWGGEYTYDNSESYKDHYIEFEEFWKHYEIVTGKKPSDPRCFFTCGC
jgi:hypothetical protein